jgi:hypothetical protein
MVDNTNNIRLIAEGKLEALILSKIFPTIKHIEESKGNPMFLLPSYAHQYRNSKIITLLDADTSLSDAIEKKRTDFIEFGFPSSDDDHFLGFFVPEIEIVFCKEKSILEKIAKFAGYSKPIDEIFYTKAQYEPKKCLSELFKLKFNNAIVMRLLEFLSEKDWQRIKENVAPIAEVEAFLEKTLPK